MRYIEIDGRHINSDYIVSIRPDHQNGGTGVEVTLHDGSQLVDHRKAAADIIQTLNSSK